MVDEGEGGEAFSNQPNPGGDWLPILAEFPIFVLEYSYYSTPQLISWSNF